jgi:hypothetical protein
MPWTLAVAFSRTSFRQQFQHGSTDLTCWLKQGPDMHSQLRSEAEGLLSTSSVLIGQKAFANYNGLVTGIVSSPVPVQPALTDPNTDLVLPPPWVAVVIDGAMNPESLRAAKQGLEQAMMQLPKQTRLLLAVVDQVVSFIDVRSPTAPAWVLHSAASKASSSLPHLVRAADIRATPLSHCISNLPTILSSIRHYPQACTQQLHLHTITSALDICIYLLTASMAAWDANQKSKQQLQQQLQQQSASSSPTQPPPAHPPRPTGPPTPQPIHSARVIFITDSHPPPATAPAAAAAAQHLDQQQVTQLQQLLTALAGKADRLDVPIDMFTGSPGAPSWTMLQPVVAACRCAKQNKRTFKVSLHTRQLGQNDHTHRQFNVNSVRSRYSFLFCISKVFVWIRRICIKLWLSSAGTASPFWRPLHDRRWMSPCTTASPF